MRSRSSLAGRTTAEVRRTLLAHGGDALERIGALKAQELVGQRRLEGRRELAVGVVERVFGPSDRLLSTVGEFGCNGERLVKDRLWAAVVVDTDRDQPDALGFLAGKITAGEQVVLRFRHPAQKWPADGGVVARRHAEPRGRR